MRKYRLQGAWLLLLIQITIWGIAAIFIWSNYINLTKEESKVEDYNLEIATLTGEIKASYQLSNNKDTISYKWKFGEVFSGEITTGGNIFSSKTHHIEKIDIDYNTIQKQLYLNYLINSWIIDIYIYDYFKNRSLDEFNKFYNNLIFLSKYFDKKIEAKGIDLIDPELKKLIDLIQNKAYQKAINFLVELEKQELVFYKDSKYQRKVLYPKFIDDEEFKYLVSKLLTDERWYYKNDLSKVGSIYWINKNLILSAIITEQLRGFYTFRWLAKEIIKTNRYVMTMYDFSLGIGWVKEITAENIENDMENYNKNIFDQYFVYTWENLNQWKNAFERLTSKENYFYQFLYSGWLIYNILQRRKVAWYDISNEPWILMTLYNFGNPVKKIPNPNPKIGWAIIRINDTDYTFGSLWAIVYYYLEIYLKN